MRNLRNIVVFLMAFSLLTGCGGGKGGTTSVEPPINGLLDGPGGEVQQAPRTSNSTRTLYGLWDCFINTDTNEVEAIPLRQAEFHANLVVMLNAPGNVKFKFVSGNASLGEFTFDITLVHPYTNPQFSGYDVRGIVFGDGIETMGSKDNPDIVSWGTSGFRLLNADGYTRWWNPKEFGTPGFYGFTQGMYGTLGFPSEFASYITLHPYKYFATILGAQGPVQAAIQSHGEFTAGSSATRRYEMRFPMNGGQPNTRFQYGVDASWPGNCPEPFHIEVGTGDSTVYYKSGTEFGGDIVLDIEVFDWDSAVNPEGIDGEIVSIKVESPTLFDTVQAVPLISQAGNTPFSGIYHIVIPNAHPTGNDNQEVMISVNAAGSKTYKPPVNGPKYPEAVNLATYLIIEIPVAETDFFISDVTPLDLNFAPNDTKVVGDYLYAACGPYGLQIFDNSDPVNPKWIQRVDAGLAVALEIIDGYAYVVSEVKETGLYTINVKSPGWAYPAGFIPVMGWTTPSCVAVADGYAYVGSSKFGGVFGEDRIKVVDVAIPESPAPVTSLKFNTYVESIAVAGNYAYVANMKDGLAVLDIHEPESISVVKTVDINQANDVVTKGGLAYVADGSVGDLMVVDISQPDSAEVINSVLTFPWKVRESGGYLYMPHLSGGLAIANLQNPESPEVVQEVNSSVFVKDVEIAGTYGYLGAAGLEVMDVSVPEVAEIINSIGLSNGMDVAIYGNYAYIIDSSDIVVLDITTPESASIINRVKYYAYYRGELEVAGDYLYASHHSAGLKIYDLSSPESPVLVKTVDAPNGSFAIDVAGDYCYMVVNDLGLQIVDISTPESAYIINTVPFQVTFGDIEVSSDLGLAFVVADAELEIIDIDPPESASVVNTIPSWNGYDMATSGNYLYGGSQGDFLILDVSSPESIQTIKTLPDYKVDDIDISNGYAFTVKYNSDSEIEDYLQVFDIDPPGQAHLVVEAQLPDNGLDVLVHNGYIFIADDDGGLRVLKIE